MVLSSLSALRCSPSTLSHHFIFPSTNIILDNLAQYRALNLWVLFSIKKYWFLYHFDHLCQSWMVFYNWLVQNPKVLAQSGRKKLAPELLKFLHIHQGLISGYFDTWNFNIVYLEIKVAIIVLPLMRADLLQAAVSRGAECCFQFIPFLPKAAAAWVQNTCWNTLLRRALDSQEQS